MRLREGGPHCVWYEVVVLCTDYSKLQRSRLSWKCMGDAEPTMGAGLRLFNSAFVWAVQASFCLLDRSLETSLFCQPLSPIGPSGRPADRERRAIRKTKHKARKVGVPVRD